jgi:hypothetical protein
MADLDVSELMSDPDFCDTVQLIRRTSDTNDQGRNVLIEADPLSVSMVVQGLQAIDFKRYPDLVNFDGARAFWYSGTLLAESESQYSDIVVFNGLRYQIHKIDEDFRNYGNGFVKAFGALEKGNA